MLVSGLWQCLGVELLLMVGLGWVWDGLNESQRSVQLERSYFDLLGAGWYPIAARLPHFHTPLKVRAEQC